MTAHGASSTSISSTPSLDAVSTYRSMPSATARRCSVCVGVRFVVETLDLGHGNVAEEWYRMGSPTNLTPTQTEHLRAVADGMERYVLTASSDGVLEIDVELAPWAVMSIVQA